MPSRAAPPHPPPQVTIVEIDGRPDMDQIQDAAKEITGGRSVPRVFVGGERRVGAGGKEYCALTYCMHG